MGDGAGGDRVFQPAGFWKRWPWLYGGLMCFNGLFIALNDVGSGGWWRAVGVAVGVLVVACGVWIVTFTPKAIRVNDSGVRLVAVARTTSIPWEELEAVRPAASGLGDGLIWTRRHGPRVVTSCTWEHQPEMLAEIQRHLDRPHRSQMSSE